jgi:hypothetical protein
MSPAVIDVFKPSKLHILLKPGENYTYGVNEFTGTDDGFFQHGYEYENDGYTRSDPQIDKKYSDSNPSIEFQDWQGVIFRIKAVSKKEIGLE